MAANPADRLHRQVSNPNPWQSSRLGKTMADAIQQCDSSALSRKLGSDDLQRSYTTTILIKYHNMFPSFSKSEERFCKSFAVMLNVLPDTQMHLFS